MDHASPLERPRRRQPFDARGAAVVLADGQTWTLPKPLLGLFPEVGADGTPRFGVQPRFHFGARYDALIDAFAESDDGVAEANALLALALDLLGRNYDLAGLDLGALLPRLFHDDRNAEMWRAIAEAALGKAPKPTPVG